MAFGTMAKIFKNGRAVWVAEFVDSEEKYRPTSGQVIEISRGRVHVKTCSREILDFSPNDRKLCLTNKECLEICGIINAALK